MERSSSHPRWLEYLLKTRRSYIKEAELTDGYQSTLTRIYELLRPEQSNLLGLFPVAHEDQTAFIVCKEPESAVFFDIGQAAILKSAYAAMSAIDPETEVFQLFLATASLKISPADIFLADKLGDSWSGKYDGPPFVSSQLLNAARGTLATHVKVALQPLFDFIVDCTIIAHELYHYRTHRSQAISGIEQVVADHYDAFVRFATENVDAFPTDYLSDLQREKYARERIFKRNYYIQERGMIAEEIACDLFAFTSAANIIVAQTKPEARDKLLFEKIIALQSIAFNLHLLHLAFTERAQLFATHGQGYELPGSMSLYNLRRVAAGVLSSEWCAATLCQNELSEPKTREPQAGLSEHFQQLQNRLYIEMSNDVLMPAIPRLNGCFSLIERTFPRHLRAQPGPTANPTERLFLSSLPFRLNESVLDRMLCEGAKGLHKKVLPFLGGQKK